MKRLLRVVKEHQVIMFGTGRAATRVVQYLSPQIKYSVDNNQAVWNTIFQGRQVYPPSCLMNENKENISILVASSYYNEIAIQLLDMGYQENVHFWDAFKMVEQLEQLEAGLDPALTSAMDRLNKYKFSINTVIDVGASDGSWSTMAMKYYEKAAYCLIEAYDEHEHALKRLQQHYPEQLQYMIAAAGNHTGSAHLLLTKDKYGGAVVDRASEHSKKVPMVMIDEAIQTFGCKPPYLLKLDTHGFEVPILEGATNMLRDTSVVIMEAYTNRIQQGRNFYEMCTYMEQLGFKCVDICAPLYDHGGRLLLQVDLFFIKKELLSVKEELK
ncbi:FkbM family methyltransferase [Marinicrinis sediminis]|uniref:FkbM family methyltransferase n=1 Tax=Marinicrinis sediminis TaxID=1652465 RepID=A0ABW5RAI0_9BACL